MIWLLFSILTAFCDSWKDVLSKKNVSEFDPYVVAWALKVFALPFLLPFLFVIDIPKLNSSFWIALFVSGGLNILTAILYMKALQNSELSLTIPMITFTPLFLLVTSPIIVGEFPTAVGAIGVLFIVVGSYILNNKERNKGLLAPLRALIRQRGPRLMLFVAFLWSITSNFDKVGVKNSSPLFWCISVVIFISFCMIPIIEKRLHQIGFKQFLSQKNFFIMGFFYSLTLIFQMTAISLTLVAYVIAIKRLSVLLGVLWGYFIFKEKAVQERLLGATIMVMGVVLICLF